MGVAYDSTARSVCIYVYKGYVVVVVVVYISLAQRYFTESVTHCF